MKKYVSLEHLTLPYRGIRFWSTNTKDNTHSMKGELWYKEILFTNDEEEAVIISREHGNIPTQEELLEYFKNNKY